MNKYNPYKHHRRSIRLQGYDYSQAGLYFITICCQDRACLFGEIVDGEMICNDAGNIANQCWLDIPNHFPNMVLHEYVVMPNHIHGIVEIIGTDNVGAKNISPNNNVMANDDVGAKNISPYNNVMANDDGIGANDYSPLPPNGTSKTIGSMVRGFKIGVTKWIRQNTNVYDVWQRNYYEHIIRNEQSYHRISNYIINNPKKWNEDKFYKNG